MAGSVASRRLERARSITPWPAAGGPHDPPKELGCAWDRTAVPIVIVRPALTGLAAELRSLGPYFALDEHRPESQSSTWWSMGELVAHPEVLQQHISAVRQVLAARAGVPADVFRWRVAASTVQFGLTARLLAPALGAAVLTGGAPGWRLADLHWQRTLAGPFPLAITPVDGADDAPADGLGRWITGGPIGRVTEAVLRAGPVSRQVLQGNVASALDTAARQIITVRTDLAQATTAVVDAVNSEQPFSDAGTILPSGRFRRRSCCLIYHAVRPVPTGVDRVVCGDCVLAD